MRKRKYCNISAQQTLLQTAMDNLNSNIDLLQYQSMSEEKCLQMLLNRLDKKNVCQKFGSEDINVPTSHNMVLCLSLHVSVCVCLHVSLSFSPFFSVSLSLIRMSRAPFIGLPHCGSTRIFTLFINSFARTLFQKNHSNTLQQFFMARDVLAVGKTNELLAGPRFIDCRIGKRFCEVVYLTVC